MAEYFEYMMKIESFADFKEWFMWIPIWLRIVLSLGLFGLLVWLYNLIKIWGEH